MKAPKPVIAMFAGAIGLICWRIWFHIRINQGYVPTHVADEQVWMQWFWTIAAGLTLVAIAIDSRKFSGNAAALGVGYALLHIGSSLWSNVPALLLLVGGWVTFQEFKRTAKTTSPTAEITN